jgi:molecular chaperone HtpG
MVTTEKGSISIHTENIFPIIKKFLYSDHEIFLRELVSNATDASQKIKSLSGLGEYTGELGDLEITVKLDKEAKTITISDKGLGMTADEIKKYINQIAFSGAKEFLETYKEQTTEQIIGQFGLGFYSAFMVASQVEIITKSHKDEPAARWICDGSTEFEITAADKTERGTDIILHIAPDSEEFLDEYRLEGILKKYCRFMPLPIKIGETHINATEPLYTKSPRSLEDKDYLDFYQALYPYAEEPLFWIHLNVDYPFNLTGILYFPKVKNEMEMNKHKVQLYSKQVFITDELKDVMPEFLTLLHGVIDSPDIPLNVSRSYLQADKNVKQLSDYIMRKVADKLNELFKESREAYEQKWDAIGLFVKYGYISEPKFEEKAKDILLVKNSEGKYFSTTEYTEFVQAAQTDKNNKVVFLYANEPKKQDFYVSNAKAKGYDVLEFEKNPVDDYFVRHLGMKLENVVIRSVDSATADKLIEQEIKIESILSDDEVTKLKDGVRTTLNLGENEVITEAMSPTDMPIQVVEDEMFRQFAHMMPNAGSGGFNFNKVVVNTNHPLATKFLANPEANADAVWQAYDLALLSLNKLDGERLTSFIKRSLSLIS